MATLEIAKAPVAFRGNLGGATNAAQTLAALHAIQQGFEHWRGGFAERDDEDAFVGGKSDGVGSAAVGHEAVESVALKAQAAVEGGSNVACLESAGKNFGGCSMK